MNSTENAVVFNQAAQGGGVFSLGPVRVTNSTVSTNTAVQGGGIYFQGDGKDLQQAALTLSFSTIAANSPPATTLLTAFTIDDGVKPPVTAVGEAIWECAGAASAAPRKLRLRTGN